jgi:hypothetical protein
VFLMVDGMCSAKAWGRTGTTCHTRPVITLMRPAQD